MAVVLFDHPRVGVAEVLRDHQQWRASHNSVAGIGVPQGMEVGSGLDPRCSACFGHWAGLIRLAPPVAVGLPQHQLHAAPIR